MNWQTLLLSAEGRIGRKDFWIGVLVLMLIWVVSLALHLAAPFVSLILLYPWICVFAKRLHDFGKTGWLILIPFAVTFVALILAVVLGGIGIFGAVLAANNAGNHATWQAMFGALGLMLGLMAVAGLVKLVFTLWVGLSPGDPAANRYGPPPEAAQPPTQAAG